MSYAIIGLGKIGTAIAQAFAVQDIEVVVAGRRPLDAAAAQIGPSLVPQRLEDAVKADVVILAVPYATHRDIGRAAESWQGKIVIDATNAFGIPGGTGRAAVDRGPCEIVPGGKGGEGLQPSASGGAGARGEDAPRGPASRVHLQ